MASGNGTQYLKTGGTGKVPQWWGVYHGYIAVNQDPADSGRVKLRVPQVLGNTTSGWAAPMVPVSYIPKVGTQVTVMFVGGDPTQPVWFGNFALPGAGQIITGTTPPSSDPKPVPPVGTIYYEVTDSGTIVAMYEWNGAGWVDYYIGGGTVASGTTISDIVIEGSQFIAYGTTGDVLVYQGLPAFGNLTSSISPDSGTDAFGNAYLAGMATYDTTAVTATQLMDGSVNYFTATTLAGPWAPSTWQSLSLQNGWAGGLNIAWVPVGPGGGAVVVKAQLVPPGSGGVADNTQIAQLPSGYAPVSSARITLASNDIKVSPVSGSNSYEPSSLYIGAAGQINIYGVATGATYVEGDGMYFRGI